MNNTTEAADHILNRYTVSQIIHTFAPIAIWAERVIPPVWYVIGFLGNPLSAAVWLGRRMRRNNSSAVYLGWLAVSDTAFLLLHLLHALHVTWGLGVYTSAGGCEVFMVLFYVPQYLSVLLVAAFTVERYVAVCHPFLKEKWCTVRRACLTAALCTLLASALSSAQAYLWTYVAELQLCTLRREAVTLSLAWRWGVDMLVFAALPLAVLVFNVLVLRDVIRLSRDGVIQRQQRGRGGGGGGSSTTSTVTLLAVSFFLVVTQLTATLVSNLELAFPMGPPYLSDRQVRAHPTWSHLFQYLQTRKVIETLCLSHFACNVLVYCATGRHFRREAALLLSCHGRWRCLLRLLATPRRDERYSMVSSNGHTLATDTGTTALTTAM